MQMLLKLPAAFNRLCVCICRRRSVQFSSTRLDEWHSQTDFPGLSLVQATYRIEAISGGILISGFSSPRSTETRYSDIAWPWARCAVIWLARSSWSWILMHFFQLLLSHPCRQRTNFDAKAFSEYRYPHSLCCKWKYATVRIFSTRNKSLKCWKRHSDAMEERIRHQVTVCVSIVIDDLHNSSTLRRDETSGSVYVLQQLYLKILGNTQYIWSVVVCLRWKCFQCFSAVVVATSHMACCMAYKEFCYVELTSSIL